MIKNEILFVLIFLIIPLLLNNIVAQNNNYVKITQTGFEITLENLNYRYSDEIKGNFVIRDYYDFTDESSSGNFKLPSRNLIIALPPNTAPKISLQEFRVQKHFNIVPALHPSVELINDSTIIVKQMNYNNYRTNSGIKPPIEFKGYLWFRDFYCVQITLNTHQFDESSNVLTELLDLKLKVDFESNINLKEYSPIEIKSPFDHSLKVLFANSTIAEQFRVSSQMNFIDTTGNWINYSAPYLKIGTVTDGIFRITKQDLESFGINTTAINPKTFQLFESGSEKPIIVTGEDDLSFDNQDYIEFFGTKNYSKISPRIINANNQPYNNYLDKYTDTTIYFLTWNTQNGLRAKSNNTFITSLSDTLTHFTQFMHYEENIMDALFYTFHNDLVESQFPYWDTGKGWYWMWLAIWASNRPFTIPMSDIVSNKQAKFYAKLTSRGSTQATNVHLVKLLINNTLIDSQVKNRYDRVLLEGSISSNSLINGNNTLRITYNEYGSASNGQMLIDWVEVEYPRRLKLIDSVLYFEFRDSLPIATRIIKIENVPSTNYHLFKVKPDFAKVTAFNIIGGNLYFTDTISTNDAFILLKENAVQKPLFFKYKTFTNLRSQNSQVDYIAIAHSKFATSVPSYINYISNNYQVTSNIYYVEDIFDEFGYGYPTAESIKEFIKVKFQSAPSPKPSYLVFFGDANYDYKGYRAQSQGIVGGGNYVPSFGYPVSDQYYAVWGTQTFLLPQMYVGRIPINSNSEMEFYSSKVRNNLERPYDDWNKKYLFFSGGRANFPDEILTYKEVNDSVINNFVIQPPLAGKYNHFYKTTNPTTDFGPYSDSEIKNAIEQGAVFISYIGHSGTATWDNSISDVKQLKNKVNRNSIISDFGCSTNKFAEPDIVSFGERFLLDIDGQSLGYIGNSALGFVSTAIKAPGFFYKSIIQDSIYCVGRAHVNAKILMYSLLGSSNVVNQFAVANTLIGDPIVEIKIPPKPNLTITNKDLLFETALINDASDSTNIKVAVNNFGIKTQTTFRFLLKHTYRDTLVKLYDFNRSLPNFSDTMSFGLMVYKKPGLHKVEIILDAENSIDEIYENDNSISLTFNVASTSIRDLLSSRYSNPKLDSLMVLSPSSKSNLPLKLILQSSSDESFGTAQQSSIILDTFVTKLNLSFLPSSNRIFSRYKLEDATDWSLPFSFDSSVGSKFFINDEYAWNKQTLNKLRFNNNGVELTSDTINISVISAGGYAGQYCIITKNGINLLTNTFFQGIGIVVFNEVTLEVDTSAWFDIFNNEPQANAFSNLVNSIPANKLVALGVSGDAKNNNFAVVNNAVLSLGGTRFPELQFKAPYILFGKKGADSTQVKQFIKNPFEGPIQADTILFRTIRTGLLISDKIGPASKWKKLKVVSTLPNNAQINFRPLGVRSDDSIDILPSLNIISGEADLSNISSNTYSHLFIQAEFQADSALNSPNLQKLEVDYDGLPELGTNFQAVKLNRDTLEQGELSSISFFVFNSGDARADSFKVKVHIFRPDNSSTTILDSVITLNAAEKRFFEANYSTTFESGLRLIKIAIDEENKIFEYYKDNNVYLSQLYIKADTTNPNLRVTFDGHDILNGDYVSPKPIILMELSDPSELPIVDTSSISIILNDTPIYFTQNPDVLTYSFSPINPKMIVQYKPFLTPGEYELKVFANDGFGNLADSLGLVRRFIVANETQMLNVFNYPNPVRQNTYFTFRLTQVPDEIKILVYTISGRLVKEIVKKRNELSIDFNKIFWDCTDEDGDLLGNGTYFYKVIMNNGDRTESSIHKLAIVR